MDRSSSTYAAESCWTCRRRRRRCDRLLPACHKCDIMQDECLGYAKERPLRWTNSVASRGKWMGKSVPSVGSPMSIGRLLIDPGLQDLTRPMREYIAYFERNCSPECVIYDLGPNNPFKEFMTLIPSSRGLCHIMVSVAALHQAQRELSNSRLIGNEQSPGELDTAEGARESSRFHEYLYHKQQALYLLRTRYLEAPYQDSYGVIALVFLFIWLACLESGRNTWAYHLKGLKELMQAQLLSMDLAQSTSLTAAFSRFYEYFETSYAIFEILGSTLVKSKQQYKPLFTSIPMIDILKRSESLTWTGCPADLLYILSLVNSACSGPIAPDPNVIAHLFSQTETFSPQRWAFATPNGSQPTVRYHVACIYKAAALIYISQVFPHISQQPYSVESHLPDSLDSIIAHFTAVGPGDSHFKGLLWPAFMIGAEARTEHQRSAIMEVLDHLWKFWRAQNVRYALEVLQRIWERQTTTEGASQPWIEYLYEQGENWIFV
ncbi:fungal-specific transcription factor domain-containing protein [Aspergillus pseudotamarii]|uniref:Fungal-specific transcription factor domain-containing protein n=1 Tax=Aspergillus pseudotamarii TaxID=132259 RepID=A0A5N6SZX1_ASPPS|nr:fungal-specific transcription factor domain-containing protein [Aspergillus pseudotamarii]KAE8138993.1 fungal-specific transcription factor domain-containing protein [Aspergillus pseudotamarii]